MKTLEELQSGLYWKAKENKTTKFYTLHDKICRDDVLQEAWRRVAQKHGAAGVDGQTIQEIKDDNGIDNLLLHLKEQLQSKTYRVGHIRRVFIPKSSRIKSRSNKTTITSTRPIGIPTIKDRIVQQAVRLIIEPIFEADFEEFSYGYRPNKSAKQASIAAYKWLNYGLTDVIEADIENFFDSINHDRLISILMERIADGYIIKLIREWLRAGVVVMSTHMDKTTIQYTKQGTPQGGVISPLLANIYLNKLDVWWRQLRMNHRYVHNAQMIRYADDVVVFTDPNKNNTEHVKDILFELLAELGLNLNTQKTSVTSACNTTNGGFDFLGFHFQRRYYNKNQKEVTRVFPSRTSVSRFRDKVKVISAKNLAHIKSEEQVIKELNQLIIGWSNYYNHTQSSETYRSLQHFVEWKVRKFFGYKHKYRRLAASHDAFEIPYKLGLAKLAGRISYMTD